jgi:2-dehydropantoate 2-reductase
MKQDVLLVGTGALATLFAARLGRAGHQIHLLGTWKQGLDALRKRGARLLENGNETAYDVHATSEPGEVRGIKLVLVLVKSWQTGHAALQLNECLPEDGMALTLQNGLGNYETLARVLGAARAAQGVTTTGATLLEAGLVRAGGEGKISIGQDQTLVPLEAVLRSGGFHLDVVADARSLVWGKLVINSAINPLTALLRISNGELLARPQARQMMAQLACETAEVANAENIRLPFDDPVSAVEEVARLTAANYSSMYQDVQQDRPTETDAINGAVVKRGAHHGIPTPYNLVCWQFLRSTVPNETHRENAGGE